MSKVKKCSCGAKMQLAGRARFRIGGMSGGWQPLFGALAELGEDLLPFYIYVCPACGKIELFADEKTKQRLLEHRVG